MNLANGWEIRRLDQLGAVYSGATPSTTISSFWDGDIVWVTPNDLSTLKTPFLRDSNKRITRKGLKNSSAHLLPPRSLVVSSRAPIGYIALPLVEFSTNQGCKSIRLKDEYCPEFAYYNILFNIERLKRLGEGTTFAEISKSTFASVALPFATAKPVQCKIAEVLLALDRAIEQTEALIAKHQRIKTGLMHDILTRGIGRDGKVRTELTHQFKSSSLGRIPAEWNVRSLGEILQRCGGFLQTGPFGSQLHSHEYAPDGVPVVMPQDIEESGISMGSIARISEAKAELLGRHRMAPGDVVFARRGDLSRCAAIGTHQAGWLCGTGCLLLRPPAREISAEWLVQSYKSHPSQVQVGARAVGSTMPNLNTGVLRSLLLAVPPLDEQRRIVEAMNALGTNESTNREQLIKLRSLKTALMQDLLTGRKPVTPLLPPTEDKPDERGENP
jgi:type I restriction enzyme S subunit